MSGPGGPPAQPQAIDVAGDDACFRKWGICRIRRFMAAQTPPWGTCRVGLPDRTLYNRDMEQVRAKLSQVIDAIEMTDDQSHAFFDRQTGGVQIISDEDVAAAEDEQLAAEAPEWGRDSIAIARQIEAGRGERFPPL